ncbi:Dot/Icm T4SS effector Wip [Legionella micdadei]|uniref:WipA-like phosphatase domain-containing protein n=1 Tax=Legionella micdadei TaxID=451 RepID=A0A098GHV7_LEGMI|nr:Dot/Icm T4SS effector Wip [Legionella micdadei]ARG96587.1 hypothetical protein B6N58_02235 [Legionella micdadei]ARG99336.1 hypothetical protein B6V88_02225 [Legionella micdadei]KTD27339.1 hypothetical protein Lmic_2274 [Legionella micdadei]CEG62049.1 protein of unknown function [Legionella micdadei]SCY75885.1 hypothetical protein SAMN02982997_02814 [Legionella micdadei]
MTLIYRAANLRLYPKVINHQGTHVCLGDLHGNALKLIYTLIEENVLNIDPQQYNELTKIYFKPTGQINSDDLFRFRAIIANAKINKARAVTLIGDELADRGQNDYFTLLVLKKLHDEKANVNIMLSNHSVEFIRDYEREKFTGQYRLLEGQGRSLEGMQTLIKKGLIDEKEVRDIVEQCYQPMVKAIDYTLTPEGQLTIFSHAPIGLETVKALAEKFRIPYRDDSIRNLIRTIDAINKVIEKLSKEKQLAQLIELEGLANPNYPIPLTKPLQRLIWNRALGNELMTEPTGGFKVKFVHGHVGPMSVLKNGSEALPTHENLDTLFGKSFECSKTGPHVTHLTRHSSEITAKELTDEQLKEISRQFFKAKFNEYFDELKLKTSQLIDKGNSKSSNYDPNYAKAGKEAAILISELKQAADTFFKNTKPTAENFIAFKTHCEKAISNAEKEFVNHRSWHQQLSPSFRRILGLLALLPLGIPALVISFKSQSGYIATFFGKPSTESVEKLQTFKNRLSKMNQIFDEEIIENELPTNKLGDR